MSGKAPQHFGWLGFALAAVFRQHHDPALREIEAIAERIDARATTLASLPKPGTLAQSIDDIAERLKA